VDTALTRELGWIGQHNHGWANLSEGRMRRIIGVESRE
jgi:hypothetical protein